MTIPIIRFANVLSFTGHILLYWLQISGIRATSSSVLEFRGTLNNREPQIVQVLCYVGKFDITMNELLMERAIFSNYTQTMEGLARMNFTSVVDLRKNHSTANTSNAHNGLVFTMLQATCEDAGRYRCNFRYTFTDGVAYTVTVEQSLHQLPSVPLMQSSEPRSVNTAHSLYTLTLSCSTFTTLEKFQWRWEMAFVKLGEKEATDWTPLSSSYVKNVLPAIHQRCVESSRSTLQVPASSLDAPRRFRCFVMYDGGQSDFSYFTQTSFDNRADINVAGWIAIAFVLLVIFVMIMLAFVILLCPQYLEPRERPVLQVQALVNIADTSRSQIQLAGNSEDVDNNRHRQDQMERERQRRRSSRLESPHPQPQPNQPRRDVLVVKVDKTPQQSINLSDSQLDVLGAEDSAHFSVIAATAVPPPSLAQPGTSDQTDLDQLGAALPASRGTWLPGISFSRSGILRSPSSGSKSGQALTFSDSKNKQGLTITDRRGSQGSAHGGTNDGARQGGNLGSDC